MGDVEQIRECASGLYALALKARDNNFNDYAAQLEELAADASACAEAKQGSPAAVDPAAAAE
jgi:hypothetical protein